jgi:type I restriction enzyme, S subunit
VATIFLKMGSGLNDHLSFHGANKVQLVESIEHEYLSNSISPCHFQVEEQSAISAFLDRETAKIDELVAEQEKLIELLKEKRQGGHLPRGDQGP